MNQDRTAFLQIITTSHSNNISQLNSTKEMQRKTLLMSYKIIINT